jgi:uncharacterized membrane protein YhaH (DUF805 family)
MSAKVGLLEHFKRLTDFRGREDRASFWPYAALAFVIDMIAGMFIFLPMMLRAVAGMQRYAQEHPEQATVTSGPGHYSISIEGGNQSFFDAESMAAYLAVTFGLALILFAAAVTRRLHDRGKSGFWGLMPLPFIIYSSLVMPSAFAMTGEPNMTLFFSIFFSNMLYLVALGWLIVMLAGPSDTAPNRYDSGTVLNG